MNVNLWRPPLCKLPALVLHGNHRFQELLSGWLGIMLFVSAVNVKISVITEQRTKTNTTRPSRFLRTTHRDGIDAISARLAVGLRRRATNGRKAVAAFAACTSLGNTRVPFAFCNQDISEPWELPSKWERVDVKDGIPKMRRRSCASTLPKPHRHRFRRSSIVTYPKRAFAQPLPSQGAG